MRTPTPRLMILAPLCAIALWAPSCSKEPEPSQGARPAADISIPPSLVIVADERDPVLFSGAAIRGETATPLFRGRLSPPSASPLAAPARPADASLRIRVTRAPVAERGEDSTWIKPATDPGVTELPKTAATGEYVYTGGDIILHIRTDSTGRPSLVPENAPAAPPKK